MIFVNTSEIKNLFFGGQQIEKIYSGSALVWQNKIKLATPTNLSITDNTLSFDEVEFASGYSIYAGNTLLGDYLPSGYMYMLDNGELTVYNADYNNYSISEGVVTFT